MTCDSSEVFSEYFSFPTNKTDRHDITEILLNVTVWQTWGVFKAGIFHPKFSGVFIHIGGKSAFGASNMLG